MTIENVSPTEATQLLKLLAVNYSPRPAPWAMPEMAEADRANVLKEWVRALCQFRMAPALVAMEQMTANSPDWVPTLMRFRQELERASREDIREISRARNIERSRRCDGTGWMESGDGYRPCPACNPFLSERFSDGVLHVTGEEHKKAVREWADENAMPAPCRSIDFEGSAAIPPSRGVAIAREAYLEELDRLDEEEPIHDKAGRFTPRTRNLRKFDQFIATVGTDPE